MILVHGISGILPFRSIASLKVAPVFEILNALPETIQFGGEPSKDRSVTHTRSSKSSYSAGGMRESQVHDVIITEEAPNYKLE